MNEVIGTVPMIDIRREQTATLEEAADRLKVNVVTVRRWAAARQLETYRAGRSIRTSWEAVQRFIGQSDDTDDLAGAGAPVRPSPSDDARRQLLERHGI